METLSKIQAELKCPKGSLNKFGNYKYRSAEQILESVKPILAKHGATLILSDTIIEVGSKLFLKATATIYFLIIHQYTNHILINLFLNKTYLTILYF